MTKLGVIKLLLETLGNLLLLILFPFTIQLKIKLLILFVITQIFCGRYHHKALLIWDELKMIAKGTVAMFLVSLMMVSYDPFSWRQLLFILLYLIIGFCYDLLINRYAHIWFKDMVRENTLVIGAGSTASHLKNITEANRFSLIDILGFVDPNDDSFFDNVHQTVVKQKGQVYPLKELESLIKDLQISTVIVAVPEMEKADMKRIMNRLYGLVETVKYIPNVEGEVNFASNIDDFDGTLLISTSRPRIKAYERALKRTMDFIASIPGMLLLIPLTAYVWVSNRRQGDTDPLFFVQERIGEDGELFKMYKFRSMVPNAEALLDKMMEENPEIRKEYEENKKLKNDPRITKAGKFLREKSLDEFPQFFNVFLGDMSLVGPRPYLPREEEDMGNFYSDIVSFKPGITGMWQTHGRSDVDFATRLELDSFYSRNWNLWLDTTIFLRTIKSFLNHDHSDAV